MKHAGDSPLIMNTIETRRPCTDGSYLILSKCVGRDFKNHAQPFQCGQQETVLREDLSKETSLLKAKARWHPSRANHRHEEGGILILGISGEPVPQCPEIPKRKQN